MKVEKLLMLWCFLIASCLRLASAEEVPSSETEIQSRSEQIQAERDTKSQNLYPPTRNKVERFMNWYDNQYVLAKITNGWKGFRFGPGYFPAGAGMKFGLTYSEEALFKRYVEDDQPNRIDLNANVSYATRNYSSFGGSMTLRNIGGIPVDFTAGGSHFKYPEEDFFGLGQDSLEDNRTNYLMRSSEYGGDLQWRPHRFMTLKGGASYLTPEIDSGEDDRFPSVEQVFNPDQIPGFSEQPDFLKLTANGAFDWRDNPEHPHHGGFYSLTFADYQDRDLDRYDFQLYNVELHQYIPLSNRYRILALRAAAVLTDTNEGQEVPFYYMPTLGGHKDLRGFREFRFRDQNSLVLSAEYRWEAWWALDGALFVDAGQVAERRQDFSAKALDFTYGFGLRFHSNKKFVLRFDFCFSKEGFIPMLRWENAF